MSKQIEFQLPIHAIEGMNLALNLSPGGNRALSEAKNELEQFFRSDLLSRLEWDINDKAFVEELKTHCANVAKLTLVIAEQLDDPTIDLKILALGAIFHDIGKLDPRIKPLVSNGERFDRSTHEGREKITTVAKHAEVGAQIVLQTQMAEAIREEVAELVLKHHENQVGSGNLGYQKQEGEEDELPFSAQIITVADAFVAMTEDRGYNVVKTTQEALNEIVRCKDQFNPQIASALTSTRPFQSDFFDYQPIALSNFRRRAK